MKILNLYKREGIKMTDVKVIKIDEVEYVRKSDIMPIEVVKDYVVIRTYSAGVHIGELVSREGKEVVLKNARRIWYWKGATTISQLAMEGVKNPSECKFSQEVTEITLTEAIEIIPCTADAVKNLKGVPAWKN